VRPCLTADRRLQPSEASFSPLPAALHEALGRALAGRGIHRLWSHQARAIEAALGGRHVVVATPTASGKSLCFHLPVLDALARDPAATALYLYPTKALGRDQEHALRELAAQAKLELPATVYDGDTPGDVRRAARERCRITLTNPDMLHSGILPHHAKWASTFQGLRFVVLDELHTYRGVFGSHMAHVVARLRRIARFHGADPVFLCATATIGNPREHAARLLGLEPEQIDLVDRSGAPRAERRLFVYNPPVVNPQLGLRGSALKHAVSLAADLVRARVSTIVFAPSRNAVEVALKYLRDECSAQADTIVGYRGGYLPDARRRVERDLREGRVGCVVATNALELGIDIGDLDAVVLIGYPGSVAETWQRFGRAGRRGEQSIAVLVCQSSPLDQFLAREPDWLLGQAEQARIDPANVEILIQHLKCAAFEAPFELADAGAEPYATLDARTTRDALAYLAGHGLVHESSDRWHWASDAFPASSVSLRSIGWDNFVIVDVASHRSIAELDWRAAHTMLHEQAIYQHDAEQWQVEKLDYENHKAFVRKVEPDYFTTALSHRTVEVIERTETAALGRLQAGLGEVKVVERVTGYKKIKFFTHENAGYGDVHLPEMQLHTTSFWLTVPEALIESLAVPRALAIDALRGIGAALELVAALALMCDPRDLGRTLGDGGDGERLPAGRAPLCGRTGGFDPTLFLFDAVPGGVGLAPRIFELRDELLGRARRLIESCGCRGGCPACIGPAEAPGARKPAALALFEALLAAGTTPLASARARV
jgi:DEAD/DEAH box helicase domain-containing protein